MSTKTTKAVRVGARKAKTRAGTRTALRPFGGGDASKLTLVFVEVRKGTGQRAMELDIDKLEFDDPKAKAVAVDYLRRASRSSKTLAATDAKARRPAN